MGGQGQDPGVDPVGQLQGRVGRAGREISPLDLGAQDRPIPEHGPEAAPTQPQGRNVEPAATVAVMVNVVWVPAIMVPAAGVTAIAAFDDAIA